MESSSSLGPKRAPYSLNNSSTGFHRNTLHTAPLGHTTRLLQIGFARLLKGDGDGGGGGGRHALTQLHNNRPRSRDALHLKVASRRELRLMGQRRQLQPV